MERNLTQGITWKNLLVFSIPLFVGNLFQQFYNIVDSIVVGNFIGEEALAAVGTGGVLMNMISSAGLGLATGSSVIIAQYYGSKNIHSTNKVIYTSIITFIGVGLIATIVGVIIMKPMLELLNTPNNIFSYVISYLSIIFLGIVFVLLFHTLSTISVALGDSKTPMYMLFIASIINIALDLVFTIVFDMGVSGVALATIISQGFAAFTCYLRIRKFMNSYEGGEKYQFDKSIFKNIIRLGAPAVVQNLISSSGLLAVQGLLNDFGSTTVAAYTAANKIDGIAMTPMVSLGTAISTFAAQNIGANKVDRVKGGFNFVNLLAILICAVSGVIIYIFGANLLGLFVDSSVNAEMIEIGVEYLRIAVFSYAVMALMFTSTGVLRGAGDVKTVFICSILDLGGRTLFAYAMVEVIGRYALWLSYPFGWILACILSFYIYFSGKWKSKRVIES